MVIGITCMFHRRFNDIYVIPLNRYLDLNVMQVQFVRASTAGSIQKENCIVDFESDILMVTVPDIRSAVGDFMRFGDNLVIAFKLECTLKESTLPDSYGAAMDLETSITVT